jgi:hypothetical protein
MVHPSNHLPEQFKPSPAAANGSGPGHLMPCPMHFIGPKLGTSLEHKCLNG